jgi:F0F1-type ATP synthase assembly protein I
LEKKPQFNQFLKYSNQAIQMILVIVAGSLGGKYTDKYFENSFPIFTLIGVLISVFAALYLAIKDFLKK